LCDHERSFSGGETLCLTLTAYKKSHKKQFTQKNKRPTYALRDGVLPVGAIHESPVMNVAHRTSVGVSFRAWSKRKETKNFDRATDASSRGIYEGVLLSLKKVTGIPKVSKIPYEIPPSAVLDRFSLSKTSASSG